MKKVLVTGAAGNVGMEVIKCLLTEGKYDIGVVDLPNSKTKSNFKKYKSRVNTYYGDLSDQNFVEDLVKEYDCIIHLASVVPPYSTSSDEIAKMTELDVTENFIRAINYYNPKCYFIFASTTSVYSDKCKSYNVQSKIKSVNNNFFAKYKLKCEKLIEEKLKYYTIVRLPVVLNQKSFIYSIKSDSIISSITIEDAGYLFAKVIEKKSKVFNTTINASGANDFSITYFELVRKFISHNGFSFRMIISLIFLDKNYYSPVCSDSSLFNDILDYQKDSMSNYLARVKYNNRNRVVSKFLGGVFIKIWEKVK